jgi:hypothetical protein
MVDIVHRAMAKDAKDRFATLNDFVRAVEDHMLPPSTLPRALTPMAGVPMFTMSEQRSGVADPVVQVLRRGEPSGLHEINETRALFTLPREISRANGRDPGDPAPGYGHTGDVQALTTTQVNLRASLRRSTHRFLANRWVPGALFAAVVLAVVWFAIPSPPHHRPGSESPSASQGARPAPAPPAPVPVVETPEPLPTRYVPHSISTSPGEGTPQSNCPCCARW